MINPQNKAINYLQKSSAINGQNLNNPNDKIMKIEYSDGTIYEGQTKSTNIRHGLGKLNFNNLGYFSGEWQNNEMSGFGSLFNESGALIYEGFWEDGNFNGAGVLTNIFHTNKIGLEIDYHDMNKIVDKWVKYEGQFQDNLANGIGKLEFCNGDIFFGNFIANKIEGKGVFIKKMNGDIIGVWKNGFLVEIL